MTTRSICLSVVFCLVATTGWTDNLKEKKPFMQTADDIKHEYTNKLAGESSPYLLSHAHNPVNWYPWGDEALNRARDLDRPVFLSIGYAACHWCHVMERESFEDPATAALLNEHFVAIKVDREQRPDLDHIYMSFTTALTGSGGWPMSVFLTPDLKPFYAGTYFPPDDRYGRPGFKRVLSEIARAYTENRSQLIESSDDIYRNVSAHLNALSPESELNGTMLSTGVDRLMRTVDPVYGGFGQEPKFPHALELSLLLRHHRKSGDSSFLQAAEKALTAMAYGGIYDHVGGGFSRYSTDRRWLVPHFEKMLYDNALLVPVYVEAYQITGKSLYLETVRRTLDFMLREMTDSSGGFYSALDADSEGEEGKFYVWSRKEIKSTLGRDANLFIDYFNVTTAGNFEGQNILSIDDNSLRVRQNAKRGDFDRLVTTSLQRLLEVRAKRVRPLTDDKILTSWNGLALSAFCRGYQITGDARYLDAAVRNASFVRETLYRDGGLVHAYREGVFSQGLFLEDYAFYVRGLLDLYESDPGSHGMAWLEFAGTLADQAIELFADNSGTFYLRDSGQTDLIIRPRDESDGAQPAPGSIMIGNLLKLNRITGETRYLETGEKALKAISGLMASRPDAMASALFALDFYLGDKLEVVVVGEGESRQRMLEELHRRYLPNRVIALSKDGGDELPLFKGRESVGGEPRAYVCINSACKMPVSTVDELKAQLDESL